MKYTLKKLFYAATFTFAAFSTSYADCNLSFCDALYKEKDVVVQDLLNVFKADVVISHAVAKHVTASKIVTSIKKKLPAAEQATFDEMLTSSLTKEIKEKIKAYLYSDFETQALNHLFQLLDKHNIEKFSELKAHVVKVQSDIEKVIEEAKSLKSICSTFLSIFDDSQAVEESPKKLKLKGILTKVVDLVIEEKGYAGWKSMIPIDSIIDKITTLIESAVDEDIINDIHALIMHKNGHETIKIICKIQGEMTTDIRKILAKQAKKLLKELKR